MKNGANPAIENLSGNSINTLLTEFYIKDLSMLIANEFTSLKYFDGKLEKSFSEYIIVKNKNGDENVEEIKQKPSVSDNTKVKVKSVQVLQTTSIKEGSSKNIDPSKRTVTIIDNIKRPIILKKPIKININKSNLIPIIRTQNIKRSSEDISQDISIKKAKS